MRMYIIDTTCAWLLQVTLVGNRASQSEDGNCCPPHRLWSSGEFRHLQSDKLGLNHVEIVEKLADPWNSSKCWSPCEGWPQLLVVRHSDLLRFEHLCKAQV
jgi:hypothetical protein